MHGLLQEAGFFDAFKPLAAFDELEEGKKPTQWWIRLLFGIGSAALLFVLYFFAPDRGTYLQPSAPQQPQCLLLGLLQPCLEQQQVVQLMLCGDSQRH